MKDTNHYDDWRSLCELASKENDPQKLLQLITRINRALEEHRRHIQTGQTSRNVDSALLPRADSLSFDGCFFPSRPSYGVKYDC